MLTENQLRQILPLLPLAKLQQYLPHLNEALRQYDIGTLLRTAAFVAQTAHESGQYNRMLESLNYTKASGLMATWPRRFPTEASALPFVRNEEKLANFVYANRMGNGDPASGDGFRYRGRGVIQLTGREGYSRAGNALGLDLVAQPDLAQTPEVAFRVAGLYWKSNGLNELADVPDFKTITRRINGGLVGLADRMKYFDLARRVLATGFVADAPVSRGALRGRSAPAATPAFSRGWQDSPDRDDLAPSTAVAEVAPKPVRGKAVAGKATAAQPVAAKAAATKPAAVKAAEKKKVKKTAKQAATRKTVSGTAVAKKVPAKRAVVKKAAAKKATAKKTAAKKVVTQKAATPKKLASAQVAPAVKKRKRAG